MTTDGTDGRPAELFALDLATCETLLGTQHVGRLVLGGVEEGVFWELLRRGYEVRAEPDDPGLYEAHAADSSVRRAVYITVEPPTPLKFTTLIGELSSLIG